MEIFVVFFYLIIVFSAIILHECAHGWMAYKLGDPTAKLAGRLTLNPIKHIDLFGTMILPGILLLMRYMGYDIFLFGWAKPVPVNFLRLRHPKRDMIWVGLAGPATNLFLAVMFAQLLKLDLPRAVYEYTYLELAVFFNLLLAVFNLLPIPPLDGSRIVAGLLPARVAFIYMKMERYGIFIVLLLIYMELFRKIIIPIIFLLGNKLGVTFS